MTFTTISTTDVFTITTTSTASTGLTYTILKARDLKKIPPKPPESSPLRGGEAVRVTCDGILHNRVGILSSFMELHGERLAFVRWPGGGWTMMAEGDLQRVGKK